MDRAFSNPGGQRSGEGVREGFLGEVGWWLNTEVLEDGRRRRGLHFGLGGGYPGGIFGDRKAPICMEAWKWLSEWER